VVVTLIDSGGQMLASEMGRIVRTASQEPAAAAAWLDDAGLPETEGA